jgi:hypothetical protein
MEAKIDRSAEFQERRKLAWRKSRFAFAVLPVSFLAAAWNLQWFLFAFVSMAAAILWLTFVCTRYYTCPSCGRIPMTSRVSLGAGGFSYSRGVDLDPEFCSNCGVRLKPETR